VSALVRADDGLGHEESAPYQGIQASGIASPRDGTVLRRVADAIRTGRWRRLPREGGSLECHVDASEFAV